ncbi:FecR domain-containing protein [Rhodopseudomonas palustris]|uniref:FecR domain-containing protein n=1 Tax=Rhodopseudomonas palustris TaxID=1076 RepID=UPI002ACDF142|nr:FecR domain-containing protein [Rhodopseudomonas palustris]WQH00464.1 FecR domain-containing protein [Rhodopseudomonas palustris]
MRRILRQRIGQGTMAALAAAMLSGSALAQEVGKASAVNPNATANMRTITIGASITHKERIRTTNAGSVQLLFIDKTSMTIGPNSDLTIDEYVYDPNAGSGKLAATLGKGALRFVGGQISHTGDAEIKTASATVGIRGGVALIGANHVYAGYGSSTVSSGGSTVTLGAGEYTSLQGGQPPSPPGPPPPNFVLNQIQMFQSGSGQTGGVARGAASPGNVQRAENRATGTPGGAVAGSLTPTPPPPAIPPINQAASTLNQSVQNSTQTAAAERTARDISPDAGNPRPSLTLSGFLGGLMHTVVNGSTYNTPASTGTAVGTATIALDAAGNRVQANLSGEVAHGPNTYYLPTTFDYQFGSTDPSLDAQSAYGDYNNFGAAAAHDKSGHPLSKINDLPITNQTGAMLTVTREQARYYATENGSTTTNFCECDYTRWGLWASQSTQYSYFDSIVGFWVAGRPTTAGEVPLSGQATYSGHVVAAIENQSDTYVATGNFQNTVNFGNRTGAVTVTGLDNTNYAGQVQFMQDPRNFAGSLAGDAGARQMALTGSFFRGVAGPASEMGGSVSITGTNYLGGGIFAAQVK